MNTIDDLARLEARLGICLPAGYRQWGSQNYFDSQAGEDTYLWVHESEWIPPRDIPDYDFGRRGVIPGLVPFAFSGGGDTWCWNSQAARPGNEFEILLCLHDDDLGDIYAPSFPAWFYRTALDYASGGFDCEPDAVEEARAYLRLWSRRLDEIQPGPWAARLEQLADTDPFAYTDPDLPRAGAQFGFLTTMEADEIVRSEFGDRYLEQTLKWRMPGGPG